MSTLDNHGNPFVPVFHASELKAYQVDTSTEGITYIRYYNANPCAVQRVSLADGVYTTEVAYGAWANRASLSYQPINAHLDV